MCGWPAPVQGQTPARGRRGGAGRATGEQTHARAQRSHVERYRRLYKHQRNSGTPHQTSSGPLTGERDPAPPAPPGPPAPEASASPRTPVPHGANTDSARPQPAPPSPLQRGPRCGPAAHGRGRRGAHCGPRPEQALPGRPGGPTRRSLAPTCGVGDASGERRRCRLGTRYMQAGRCSASTSPAARWNGRTLYMGMAAPHSAPARRRARPPARCTHWARREHGASSDWAAPLTRWCQGVEDSLRSGGPFPQRPMTVRGRGPREGILRRATRVRRVPMEAAESR